MQTLVWVNSKRISLTRFLLALDWIKNQNPPDEEQPDSDQQRKPIAFGICIWDLQDTDLAPMDTQSECSDYEKDDSD